jgi:hypothetical protein
MFKPTIQQAQQHNEIHHHSRQVKHICRKEF